MVPTKSFGVPSFGCLGFGLAFPFIRPFARYLISVGTPELMLSEFPFGLLVLEVPDLELSNPWTQVDWLHWSLLPLVDTSAQEASL